MLKAEIPRPTITPSEIEALICSLVRDCWRIWRSWMTPNKRMNTDPQQRRCAPLLWAGYARR
jgi:hypothetical protein